MDMLDVFLTASHPLRLSDIALATNVPKSTAHGILQTMLSRGYLKWDSRTKSYSLTLRIVTLAQAAPILQIIQESARPYLESLALATGELAVLQAFEANMTVVIDKVESPRQPIRYSVRMGERWPLYCTSAGKLYLAQLKDDRVRELLENEPSDRFRELTTKTVEEVIAEIQNTRSRNFAVSREELVRGLTGFGAPVLAPNGRLIAALSVVGPSERIDARMADVVSMVVVKARALSEHLAVDAQAANLI
jgi:IclR family acetate operon transcriptional repressor